MKKLLLLSLLLFGMILKSQVQIIGITDDTITVTPKKGVKQYYENVYKAQNAIVNGKLDSAIEYYFTAFNFNMIFDTDLQNLENAIFKNGADSSAFARFFILKYKYSGGRHTSRDFYNLYLKYEKYDTLNYYKNLSNILDTVKINVFYNKALDKQLSDIMKRDQSIREKFYKEKHNPEYIKKLKEVDSLNLDEVLQLYKTNLINFATCGNGMKGVEIVLTHSSVKIQDLNKFVPVILQNVYNGNFDARLFAEIIDNYKYFEDSYYGLCMGEAMFNKYIVKIPSKERINEINERRKLIFLDNILNVEEQTAFTIQSSLDWLFYIINSNYVCGDIVFMPPELRAQFIKENSKKYTELQEAEIDKIKKRGFEIIEYKIW